MDPNKRSNETQTHNTSDKENKRERERKRHELNASMRLQHQQIQENTNLTNILIVGPSTKQKKPSKRIDIKYQKQDVPNRGHAYQQRMPNCVDCSFGNALSTQSRSIRNQIHGQESISQDLAISTAPAYHSKQEAVC